MNALTVAAGVQCLHGRAVRCLVTAALFLETDKTGDGPVHPRGYEGSWSGSTVGNEQDPSGVPEKDLLIGLLSLSGFGRFLRPNDACIWSATFSFQRPE